MGTREITLGNLKQTIDSDEIVLLDFWAEWCGPCRTFGPIFEDASRRHPDIVFDKVDTEGQQDLAAAFRITSIPTLMAFRDRVLVFAQPGLVSGAQLDRLIEAVKGLDMDEVRAQMETQGARRDDRRRRRRGISAAALAAGRTKTPKSWCSNGASTYRSPTAGCVLPRRGSRPPGPSWCTPGR